MKPLTFLTKLTLVLSIFVLAACGQKTDGAAQAGNITPVNDSYSAEKSVVVFGSLPEEANETPPTDELRNAPYYTGKTFCWAQRGTIELAHYGGITLNADSSAVEISAARIETEQDVTTTYTWSVNNGAVQYGNKKFEAIAINATDHYLVMQGYVNGTPDAHTQRWYFTTTGFDLNAAKDAAHNYSYTLAMEQTFANFFSGKKFSFSKTPNGVADFTITFSAFDTVTAVSGTTSTGTYVAEGAINGSGSCGFGDGDIYPTLKLGGDSIEIRKLASTYDSYVSVINKTTHAQYIGYYMTQIQ